MSDSSFWSKPDVAEDLRSLKRAQMRLALIAARDDLMTYANLADDPDLARECRIEMANISAQVETVLVPISDANAPAIVTITAGAGGEDARDFCAMTVRELALYGENRGLDCEVQDESFEGSGVRDATLRFSGENALRIMLGEAGKRRLVRQSRFGSGGRQTSFCAVSVMPEVPVADVQILDSDLRIETYRDTGPGGQHRNTTDSAVRITHIPTGLSAKSASRSQHENKKLAMITLASRIAEFERKKALAVAEAQREGEPTTGFGGHVRTLVLDPYKLVRNELTGETSTDTDAYLNGQPMDVRAPF